MKQLMHHLNAPRTLETSSLITGTILALALFSVNQPVWASCIDETKEAEANYLICKVSAEQGDADAQSTVGKMYDYGQGVSQDGEQALAWYLKAAAQGNIDAQFNLGVMHENKQDEAQAISWYLKAAEQGHLYSQVNLGSLYSNSRGELQDYEQAVNWYRKAAEQGDAKAQSNLGLMYVYGQGVEKDYPTAYKWFYIAVKNGSEVGRKGKDISKQMMTSTQIEAAQQLATEWMAAHP